MIVRILLGAIAIAHIVNGAFMIIWPEDWFEAVPGVSEDGPLNVHFVIDVGFSYLASGVGLLIGTWPGERRAIFAVAGATWPALHAAFHVRNWIMHGFPDALDNVLSQLFGVLGLALLGILAAALRLREP